jgi:hypothetical protein
LESRIAATSYYSGAGSTTRSEMVLIAQGSRREQ